jgi:hypothetical protein
MDHGFLAPQFGLGRSLSTDLASGPTVVVKRRRQLEIPTTGSGQAGPACAPSKVPKVYRLALTTAPQREAYELEAVADTHDAGAAGRQKVEALEPQQDLRAASGRRRRRRRRDLLRVPTLVQHVVFERARDALDVHEATEIGRPPLPRDGASITPPMLEAGDPQKWRDALAVLDAELRKAVRAEQAYLALDEALRSVGI